MIDLKQNHKNEQGQFIGPYQKGDKVSCEGSNAKWTIVWAQGWKKGYACYGYQIAMEDQPLNYCNVAEYQLSPRN